MDPIRMAQMGMIRELRSASKAADLLYPLLQPEHSSMRATRGRATATVLGVALRAANDAGAEHVLYLARHNRVQLYALVVHQDPRLLHAIDEHWNNALHVAAKAGHVHLVTYLLEMFHAVFFPPRMLLTNTCGHDATQVANNQVLVPLELAKLRWADRGQPERTQAQRIQAQRTQAQRALVRILRRCCWSEVWAGGRVQEELLSRYRLCPYTLLSASRRRRLRRSWVLCPRQTPALALLPTAARLLVRDLLECHLLPVDVWWHVLSFMHPTFFLSLHASK